MNKHFFVSCQIGGEPEIFETLNLSATLQKLVRWAFSGIKVSNVKIFN